MVPPLGKPAVPPFRDSARPVEERVADLLARLTLDEKKAMLHQYAPAVPRLGLRAFRTGTEVLHGVAFLGQATVFPQAIGLGATWNLRLLRQVGAVVAEEVRRMHEADSAIGLNVWGPVVNPLRDPRWGRGEEGYSEDPRHTALMAVAYCRGLIGAVDDDRPAARDTWRTAPTLKSFLAHNHEADKTRSSSGLRARVLHEYEMRPFEEVLESGTAAGIMAAYNLVNGRPNHVSPYFRLLRARKPDLVVVSDAYGPIFLVDDAGYYEDRPHAYAAALRAGLDSFTCDFDDPAPTLAALDSAIEDGYLGEADVDAAVARLLAMRTRLGEFDLAAEGPRPLGPARPSEQGSRLAREAARQGIVLLRNEALADGTPVLPLAGDRTETLCVAGLHAGQLFHDWYSGTPPYEVTPADALRMRLGEAAVTFVEGLDRVTFHITAGGCLSVDTTPGQTALEVSAGASEPAQWFDIIDWGQETVSLRCAANGLFLAERSRGTLVCDRVGPGGWEVKEVFRLVPEEDGFLLQGVWSGRYLAVGEKDGTLGMFATDPSAALRLRRDLLSDGTDQVRQAARAADATVVVVGTHPLVNGGERYDRVDLGLPAGQEAVVRAALQANPRTAAVVVTGHPVTAPWLAREVPAVLWSSHGGQEFGNALADVLVGAAVPSGRLPQTWYQSTDDLGDILDYDIIKSRKTYLYFRGTPLFPFGHGLSYTTFGYTAPRLSRTSAGPEDEVRLDVEITNTGALDGVEVVQLYAQAPPGRTERPLRELLTFERVEIEAGAKAEVSLSFSVSDLSCWDVGPGRRVVPPGEYRLLVGSSSHDIRGEAVLAVTCEPIPPRSLTGRVVRAADFDDYDGIRIVDETKVAGDAVEPSAGMGWILFRDVALDGAARSLTARVVRRGPEPARIDLCLDRPDPKDAVARLDLTDVTSAAGWRTWTTPLREHAAGRRDVYLLLSGPVRLSSLTLDDFTTDV